MMRFPGGTGVLKPLTVDLTADEMAAVKHALDAIGRDLGLDPTPDLRELRQRLRVELERDERR